MIQPRTRKDYLNRAKACLARAQTAKSANLKTASFWIDMHAAWIARALEA